MSSTRTPVKPSTMSPSVKPSAMSPATDGIASPRGGTVSTRSSASKLREVHDKFPSLYMDLEAERQAKRDMETSHRAMVLDFCTRLEAKLDAEAAVRAESHKALESAIDAGIRGLSERLSLQFNEKYLSLKAAVDALSGTFLELHASLREEREQRQADVEHLASTFGTKLNEAQASLEVEREARMARDAEVLHKLGSELVRLESELDREVNERSVGVKGLQRDLRTLAVNAKEDAERFHSLVLSEVAAIKGDLALERQERVAEDEQIVNGLDECTRGLQDASNGLGAGHHGNPNQRWNPNVGTSALPAQRCQAYVPMPSSL
eukprot:jgi/Mesvir1/18095/Mv09396-RA.1